MFEAVRQLSGNKKSDSISVFNDKNQLVNNESDKADIIRNYFEHFVGSPQPLNNPITSFEVEQAAKNLRNGKAVGPDGIPNEFLKHSPPILPGHWQNAYKPGHSCANIVSAQNGY